ncbi:hypothetical protein ACN9MN_03020 [Chryseobacterium sp. S-02]|uniref:hypothetical protein n=1 Tax=Chryseobacterium sp. S-02 TaxID=3404064 RepID=UPI003CF1239E
MSNKYRITSWLSIAVSIGFFLLLLKELIVGESSLSEIAILPIILGIILIIDFFISLWILKQKIKPNIFIQIFQTIIIIYCLYLIYYYNSNMSVKVDQVITP